MVNEWTSRPLRDCATWYSGGTPSKGNPNYWNGSIPWISAKSLTEFFIGDSEDKVTEAGSVNGTRLVPENTILFIVRGMSLKSKFRMGITTRPVTFNQDLKALVAHDDILPAFLAYSIKGRTQEILSLVGEAGHGTGVLPTDRIQRLEILLPPLEEQRAIAHILGTLDDKIELNRKQNETLEAMAGTLFKAWFVDFEPVRAKMEGRWLCGQSLPGLPAHLYDLFPDRLVESELGAIPEEWSTLAFCDVAQQGKGAVSPGGEPEGKFTLYSLPAFDAGQMPAIELGESIKSNKTPVPDGAVLVSKLNPQIPRIWLVGEAGTRAVCSTEFIVWTPKAPANSAFVYCLASSLEFNSAMRQLVTGTSNSHQRVKPEQLREIRVFAAGESVIAAFSAMAKLSMDQVLKNRRQSKVLAQLRDTLLPKLISGELRVPDAERIVGALV
ncbi:TPA: restriction endonuclease subunit S [Pseudomonas aeruginosa]